MTESILTSEPMLHLYYTIASAALGALVAVCFKRVHHLGLCVLISFAAGALCTVAVFDLLPQSAAIFGPSKALLAAVLGYGFFHFINRNVFHLCPACSATHAEINFKALSGTMIAALTLHSFMDGLAVYGGGIAGHAHGHGLEAQASPGTLVLIAVAAHKFPEGMALALVARAGGVGRGTAFALAVGLEAATTLAAGFVGAWALGGRATLLAAALGFISGGFVFIVIHALLSELFKHHPRVTVLAALAGGGCILAVSAILGAH